jgi:hypothetical protein
VTEKSIRSRTHARQDALAVNAITPSVLSLKEDVSAEDEDTWLMEWLPSLTFVAKTVI